MLVQRGVCVLSIYLSTEKAIYIQYFQFNKSVFFFTIRENLLTGNPVAYIKLTIIFRNLINWIHIFVKN